MAKDPRELWKPGQQESVSVALDDIVEKFIRNLYAIEATAIWLLNERLYEVDKILKEVRDMKDDFIEWKFVVEGELPEGGMPDSFYAVTGDYTPEELKKEIDDNNPIQSDREFLYKKFHLSDEESPTV